MRWLWLDGALAATDRQIDRSASQLVHQLYGPSAEEIRIVEEATA